VGQALAGEDFAINNRPSKPFSTLLDSDGNKALQPFNIAGHMKGTSNLESGS
jgi:hypothetical protein